MLGTAVVSTAAAVTVMTTTYLPALGVAVATGAARAERAALRR